MAFLSFYNPDPGRQLKQEVYQDSKAVVPKLTTSATPFTLIGALHDLSFLAVWAEMAQNLTKSREISQWARKAVGSLWVCHSALGQDSTQFGNLCPETTCRCSAWWVTSTGRSTVMCRAVWKFCCCEVVYLLQMSLVCFHSKGESSFPLLKGVSIPEYVQKLVAHIYPAQLCNCPLGYVLVVCCRSAVNQLCAKKQWACGVLATEEGDHFWNCCGSGIMLDHSRLVLRCTLFEGNCSCLLSVASRKI